MGAGTLRGRGAALAIATIALTAGLGSSAVPADAAQRLYLAGGEDGLRSYDLASNGLPLTGLRATTAGSPTGVAISADRSDLFVGSLIYSGGIGTPVISSLGLNPDDGSPVAQGEPSQITAAAHGMVSSPDGSRLYAANGRTGYVTVHGVDPDGELTPLQAAETIPSAAPTGVALSPDGRNLYVTDNANYRIHQFAVGADGLLTPLPEPHVRAGDSPKAISITPDGRFVYAPGQDGTLRIYGYRVAAGGALEPLPGSPYPRDGGGVSSTAVSPDGRHLYTAGSDGLRAYEIDTDGALAAVEGAPFRHETGVTGIGLDADGSFLYTTTGSDADLQTFAVKADGSLEFVDQRGTGLHASSDSLALTPTQAPLARARVSRVGAPDNEVRFDASASSDSDGAVARFDWDFGDGTELRDGGRRPTHTYPAPGLYMASLKVTDTDGCSTEFVTSGQAAYCNGSPDAQTIIPVLVGPVGTPDPPEAEPPHSPPPPGLSVLGPRRQSMGRNVTIRFRCEPGCRARLSGSLTFAGRDRVFALGTAQRRARAGEVKRVRLALPRNGERVAGAAKRGVANVKVVAVGSGGAESRARTRVRLGD